VTVKPDQLKKARSELGLSANSSISAEPKRALTNNRNGVKARKSGLPRGWFYAAPTNTAISSASTPKAAAVGPATGAAPPSCSATSASAIAAAFRSFACPPAACGR
jgi:hypothetical protein